MLPVLHVHKGEDNTIEVYGKSQDFDLYLNEKLHISSYERYKYSESYTVNIVTFEQKSEETYFDSSIKCHETSIDVANFALDKDGIYNIYHIIIPSLEWLLDKLDNNINFLKEYNIIYVTDGDYIYKCSIDDDNEAVFERCSIEELSMVNPCGTTLFVATLTIFSTYNLYQCYLNICLELLGDPNKCAACNYNSGMKDVGYRRDLVWMALNVIEYYIKRDELEAAEQIIEDLMGCSGLCNSNDKKKPSSCGCGS